MAFTSDRYSDQMARRIRSLQRGSFDSLLRGGVYSEEDARAILPYLEVRYDPSGYCIAVIRAHRVVREVPQWSDDDARPGDDAERVLRVHIGKRGYVYRRCADEIVVFWSDAIPTDGDQLRRRIAAAAAELESRSGTALEYGIGEWQTSLIEAGRSLREAEQRLEIGALGESDSQDAERQAVPFAAAELCAREPGRSVQHYILHHYREPDLALSTIARHLDLTETYLSQVFREQTGVTYSLFLERTRVEAARRLLQASSLSVSEIASRVGYQTNSTFFRAFRRTHRQGPSAYRNAARTRSPVRWVDDGDLFARHIGHPSPAVHARPAEQEPHSLFEHDAPVYDRRGKPDNQAGDDGERDAEEPERQDVDRQRVAGVATAAQDADDHVDVPGLRDEEYAEQAQELANE